MSGNHKYSSRELFRERECAKYIQSLKDKPCLDCGVKYHPFVMEFDHLRDKRFELSKVGRRSFDTIRLEVSKCELVCANCHRMRTFKRRTDVTQVKKEVTLFD